MRFYVIQPLKFRGINWFLNKKIFLYISKWIWKDLYSILFLSVGTNQISKDMVIIELESHTLHFTKVNCTWACWPHQKDVTFLKFHFIIINSISFVGNRISCRPRLHKKNKTFKGPSYFTSQNEHILNECSKRDTEKSTPI